jgi:hypothetical protein
MHCVTTPVYGQKSVVENDTINQQLPRRHQNWHAEHARQIPVTKKMRDTQLLFDSGINIVAAFRKDDYNKGGETL